MCTSSASTTPGPPCRGHRPRRRDRPRCSRRLTGLQYGEIVVAARHDVPAPPVDVAEWGGGAAGALGVVAVAFATQQIPGELLPAAAVWALFTTTLAVHDWHHHRVHTAACWAGTVLTATAIAVAGPERLAGSAVVVGVLAGYCLLAWLVRPEALGFGDVRYAVLTGTLPGAVVGAVAGVTVLLVACVAALAVHTVARLSRRRAGGTPFAFAPYLALGGGVALLLP